MLKYINIFIYDIKTIFKACFYAFNSRQAYKLQIKKNLELDRILRKNRFEHELYLKHRHAYLMSLMNDHEDEEIFEQLSIADEMLKIKAKLDRWSEVDVSLDDIVSVSSHTRKITKDIEAKYSDGIDQIDAKLISRFFIYVLGLAIITTMLFI